MKIGSYFVRANRSLKPAREVWLRQTFEIRNHPIALSPCLLNRLCQVLLPQASLRENSGRSLSSRIQFGSTFRPFAKPTYFYITKLSTGCILESSNLVIFLFFQILWWGTACYIPATATVSPSPSQTLPGLPSLQAYPQTLAGFTAYCSLHRLALSAQRIWPLPYMMYLVEVSSFNPMGPLACSFWVLIPISAPNPNSKPSVNRVEALTYTAAASTSSKNR